MTYNPFLRDFSRRLYDGLTARNDQENALSRPDFYVFRDLLQDLLGSAAGSFHPDREVRLREFEALFRNHRLDGRYDAELVWEEVRSIIKGAKPVIRLERLKSLAQAFVFEQRRQFREAGPLFEKHGYLPQAGACYERSGLWEQALGIWEKLKDRERAASAGSRCTSSRAISIWPRRSGAKGRRLPGPWKTGARPAITDVWANIWPLKKNMARRAVRAGRGSVQKIQKFPAGRRSFLPGREMVRSRAVIQKAEEWGPPAGAGGPGSLAILVERFCSVFPCWGSNLPETLLDFLFQTRYVNGLFEVVCQGAFTRYPAPALKKFLAKLKDLAERERNPELGACHQYAQDRQVFPDSLDRLQLNGWSFKLFGASPRHYLQAVKFLRKERKTHEAVSLARRRSNFHLAGRILEATGGYAEPGRNYRDGGRYEEALRCFQLIGDESGQARVYERMGRLEEAAAIWKKRGNLKEVARLQRKLDKGKSAVSQLALFD